MYFILYYEIILWYTSYVARPYTEPQEGGNTNGNNWIFRYVCHGKCSSILYLQVVIQSFLGSN